MFLKIRCCRNDSVFETHQTTLRALSANRRGSGVAHRRQKTLRRSQIGCPFPSHLGWNRLMQYILHQICQMGCGRTIIPGQYMGFCTFRQRCRRDSKLASHGIYTAWCIDGHRRVRLALAMVFSSLRSGACCIMRVDRCRDDTDRIDS